MTRWPAHGIINIIWTKKIYNDLHVRIYVEKICVLRRPFFLSCTLFLFLSLFLSVTLFLIRSLSRSPLQHAFDSRVLIQLIASFAIAPRLRTPRLLSFLHSLVYLLTPSIRSSRNALQGGSRPPREQTHRFFVVISINKEIPIQGRTLAYPMR